MYNFLWSPKEIKMSLEVPPAKNGKFQIGPKNITLISQQIQKLQSPEVSNQKIKRNILA